MSKKNVAPVPWHTTKCTVDLLGRHSGLLSFHCRRRVVFPALLPASGITYFFKNLDSSTLVKDPMFTPHLKRTSLLHATIESPFLQLGIHVGANCFRYRESASRSPSRSTCNYAFHIYTPKSKDLKINGSSRLK